MPVTDPTLPIQLKHSLERMENTVQSFKQSIAYSAPELYDQHYAVLQSRLAEVIFDLYNDIEPDQ